MTQKPTEFIEPFAGGASISLTVTAERLANHITMVELDDSVASVWQTIIRDEGGGEWLANEIAAFVLTAESVASTLAQPPSSTREKAFQTILKNRVNRGGILAPGAGRIKEGEGGKGLLSRWYPETLKKRIMDIVAMRDRIGFVAGDGLVALWHHAERSDAVFFLDPPYTVAGKMAGSRLYTHPNVDHDELFRIASSFKGDFLMTYDDTEEVLSLAHRYDFDTQRIPMKNTHHVKMYELLVGRDLSWTR